MKDYGATITLTPDEIAGKTDRNEMLAAIASVAAQETISQEQQYGVDVHGVRFDVVRASYSYAHLGSGNILGIQLKVESNYRVVFQRGVWLKTGTLDIAKLRAAYAECEVVAKAQAEKEMLVRQASDCARAAVDEAARRAALYPDLLAELEAVRKRHDAKARLANFPLGCGCEDCIPLRAIVARCKDVLS